MDPLGSLSGWLGSSYSYVVTYEHIAWARLLHESIEAAFFGSAAAVKEQEWGVTVLHDLNIQVTGNE